MSQDKHKLKTAFIGTGRFPRSEVDAIAPHVNLVSYLDRHPPAAAEFARVAAVTGIAQSAKRHDDLRRFANDDISLYLMSVPANQVELTTSPLLDFGRTGPQLVLVSAECNMEQLRTLRDLRNAHPGVGLAFCRPYRWARPLGNGPAASSYAGFGRITAIRIRHRGDATDAQLHRLLDCALSISPGAPTDWVRGANRLESSLQGPAGVSVALTLGEGPKNLIEIVGEDRSATFEPEVRPSRTHDYGVLVSHFEDVLSIMSSSSEPDEVDRYLHARGVPTLSSEMAASRLALKRDVQGL